MWNYFILLKTLSDSWNFPAKSSNKLSVIFDIKTGRNQARGPPIFFLNMLTYIIWTLVQLGSTLIIYTKKFNSNESNNIWKSNGFKV